MAARCPVTDKVSYGSRERVEEHIAKMRKHAGKRRRKRTMDAAKPITGYYRCKHCPHFHLTTKPQKRL